MCVHVSQLEILMWIRVMETSETDLKVNLIHCITEGASLVREGYRAFVSGTQVRISPSLMGSPSVSVSGKKSDDSQAAKSCFYYYYSDVNPNQMAMIHGIFKENQVFFFNKVMELGFAHLFLKICFL